ncbi:MAG TPA: hypothetical protein VHE35_29440, partial [Kofleriaceae bacterium]|nr:hypothetical protein [Kofleriaceae bacterium]
GPDAAVDAGRATCTPAGGCALGPPCGNRCCGAGEHCEAGECRCGGRPACMVGDHCAAPGPIGDNACGSICCGASGPCPL